MKIGACMWSLSEDPHEAAQWAKDVGFEYIDVDPGFATGGHPLDGLPVVSVAIAHLMPDGAVMEAADKGSRALAMDHLHVGLTEAVKLGAVFVYLPPPAAADSSSRARYMETVLELADEAARHGLTFGIEHFPGFALSTVALTQAFLAELNHPNVFVLLDIGHAQISHESVPDAIESLGDRMAFVHFDDNYGKCDDHLALLDGLQQEADLLAAVRALRRHGYDGRVSIEMSPNLPDPRDATLRSFQILRRVVAKA